MNSIKTLVTCPGKIGDLVYALPAIRGLKETGGLVFLETSAHCRAAVPLLAIQPYLDGAFIDPEYQAADSSFGIQPWRMSEPAGYGRIIHLGLRPELGPSVMRRPLVETFHGLLEETVGRPVPFDPFRPYLSLPAEPVARAPYVVFQGHGATLMDLMPEDARKRLAAFWAALFRRFDIEIKIVTGEREQGFYAGYDLEVLCPANLLETARLIRDARLFLGVQSAAAAVADGLKAPRLVFRWFDNAPPLGDRGLSFDLSADVEEVAAALNERYLT